MFLLFVGFVVLNCLVLFADLVVFGLVCVRFVCFGFWLLVCVFLCF